MLNRILESSLRQRALVLIATAALIVAGLWSAYHLPIDAVPDITPPQVQINTEVPALAPEEIERLVTFPIESEMAGLPGMVELRSLSKFGLSQVTMIFRDNVDLLRTRQWVAERLASIENLPEGLTPRLAPISTGLGEIYYYTLEYKADATNKPPTREEQLMELKLIHDYTVKPLLRATPGVAEVNASGGYEKQIVVSPDPARLRNAGLTFADVAEVLRENTSNVGGGLVEIGGEQVVIRANTRVMSVREIEEIPLKFGAAVGPMLVRDVASVGIGSAFRTGSSTVNGDEALVGAAIMLHGENSRAVAAAVREKLQAIQPKLPEGVHIHTLYDRSHLVNQTISTVEKNLFEGALLVIAVLFGLLGNWRAALIVALVIPLSMLFAMTGMVRLGISGNLMSLGAIDFGLIVDGAVVMVENITRHLSEKRRALGRKLSAAERAREVLLAGKEVARPMFFGVMIITVVYVPILALQGIEGRMFRPMALVVMLALGGALVLALTLMPALSSLVLSGDSKETENWLVRLFKSIYEPVLRFSLRYRAAVLVPMLVLFALSLWLFSRLGAEFIPELDEGDLTIQIIRNPSIGIDSSVELQMESERVLRANFPEISETYSRIGTAEIALDPMGPNIGDTYVMLRPRDTWRKIDGSPISKEALAQLMQQTIEKKVPGQSYLVSQPIQMRFNEIMAGARANLVLKIFGPDYSELERLAGETREVLQTVRGGGESEFESVGRVPLLEITPKRNALQRFNTHAADINGTVETALAGEPVGTMLQGERRIPVVVRLSESLRQDTEAIHKLPVRTESGGILPLSQLAKVQAVEEVGAITRESTQRRVGVLINVHGRDTAGFVKDAAEALRARIDFPDGYHFEFGGQYENFLAARNRLAIVVPIALALIFALTFLSFGSLRQATLIFVSVPLAVTGGIVALWLRGMPFTISAGVGFIALSGIAVLNGIMLISYINQLREEGRSLRNAVTEGSLTRLRPKLMTAFVASFGFVPMAIATGAGAEVQRPLATVVIGGIVSSTLLTLVLLPTLYEWLEQGSERRATQVPADSI